jgi:hypothetical protein
MPAEPTRRDALLFVALGLAPAFGSVASATGRPPADFPVSHSVWTSLLREHVRPSPDGINRVEFPRFKSNGHRRLKSYIASLEQAAPSRLTRQAQKAFWINLYNAKTVDLVLERYPVASIRDVRLPDPTGKLDDGPWKSKVLTVEGRSLSLDDISDLILRKEFRDPRVHYALNCLSIGCPNLLPEAFLAERLDRQLDAAAAAFVNHPRAIAFKAARIEASSIYQWYEADFGGFKPMLAHLSRYARPELRRRLATVRKIDHYDYDWRLIDTARP